MRVNAKYGLCLTAFACLAVGCNKSPAGGAPGTANSFTFTAPTVPTTIKQGDKETVKITLNRGKDFKQAVKFKVEAPDKVKADLSKDTVAASDAGEISLTLDVGKDAALGDYKVKVTATPEGGSATTQDFTLKVEKL